MTEYVKENSRELLGPFDSYREAEDKLADMTRHLNNPRMSFVQVAHVTLPIKAILKIKIYPSQRGGKDSTKAGVETYTPWWIEIWHSRMP